MTELDRRAIITGLAAIAVAGFAAPASVAQLFHAGRTYAYGHADTLALYDAARLVLFNSLWHVELTGFDEGIFRHVESGLMFVTDHDRPAIPYRVRQITTPAAPVDDAEAAIIGVAAYHLCGYAALAGSFRREFGDRPGAFFMRHDSTPEGMFAWQRHLADAPPLLHSA